MLDIFIVFGYLILTLVLGVWVGRRVSSAEDYGTGGRQYSAWVIFAAISSSFIGGGFTLGLAEKTFLYGLPFIIAICGFSFKELLIALLIAPRIQAFRTKLTIGDIMEHAFGKRSRIFTGIASVLVCSGIIGAQISACGSLIHIFLGPPPAIGALLAASIIIIYSALGGMRSVIAVDIMHFCVFTVILPLILIFGIQEVGGAHTFLKNLPETHTTLTGTLGLKSLLILFFSFFLGETLIPPYIQRLLIGKTIKNTMIGTFGSGLFSILIFFVVGFTGMAALILAPNLSPASALPYVIQTVMPMGAKGLAIAAMLAVIMSSVDSFLNSISLACSHDILYPLNIIEKNKNHELTVNRCITVVIGTIAIIISVSLSTSVDILLYSYQFWTPFILTPFIAAILGIRSSDKAFFISTFAGIGGVLLWNFVGGDSSKTLLDYALEGTLFGITLNSLTFILYHRFFTKRPLSEPI